MVTILVILVIFAAVGGAGWFMYRWQYDKANELLGKWAEQNGYQIVEKIKANPSGTGPGSRTASNKQVMYRIKVQDAAGNERTGIAKIGSPVAGTLSDQVEIIWDGETR